MEAPPTCRAATPKSIERERLDGAYRRPTSTVANKQKKTISEYSPPLMAAGRSTIDRDAVSCAASRTRPRAAAHSSSACLFYRCNGHAWQAHHLNRIQAHC
jgi:hypothetical protein